VRDLGVTWKDAVAQLRTTTSRQEFEAIEVEVSVELGAQTKMTLKALNSWFSPITNAQRFCAMERIIASDCNSNHSAK
jgi:hypothetical protein